MANFQVKEGGDLNRRFWEALEESDNIFLIARLMKGWDGSVSRSLKTDSDGNLQVDVLSGFISPTKAATGTQSIVADTATSTTILAANAARLGASVHNDSSAALYLLLVTGGTASTTAYTTRLQQHDYFEVPFGYTGAIIGIWASDPNDGAARVMEFTA